MNSHKIRFNADINGESLRQFIADVNEIPPDSDVDIYFTTDGGEVPSYYCMLDILNNIENHVNLIASGSIQSSGFDVFFKANVSSKSILPYTIGMIHFPVIEGTLNSHKLPVEGPQKVFLAQMHKDNITSYAYLKELGLTPKELKLFKSGKDCYFSTERLNELLDGQNKARLQESNKY